MKRVLSIVLALTLAVALAGTAAAVDEPEDPFTATWPAEIQAEAKEVNPKGEKIDVLVVIDMQKDFIDGALANPDAEAIVDNVVAKIEEYKKDGKPIIATLDTHYDYYMDTQEGKNLPVPHCLRYSDGWLFDKRVGDILAGYSNLTVLEKPSFGSRDLVGAIGEYVAAYGEPNVNVEFIGVCTDICVVSNVITQKTFYPEMPISLDAACCAAIYPETHEAALATMTMCQIYISNWEPKDDVDYNALFGG